MATDTPLSATRPIEYIDEAMAEIPTADEIEHFYLHRSPPPRWELFQLEFRHKLKELAKAGLTPLSQSRPSEHAEQLRHIAKVCDQYLHSDYGNQLREIAGFVPQKGENEEMRDKAVTSSISRKDAVTLFCEIANRRLTDAECFNLTENMRLAITEFAQTLTPLSAISPMNDTDNLRAACQLLDQCRDMAWYRISGYSDFKARIDAFLLRVEPNRRADSRSV